MDIKVIIITCLITATISGFIGAAMKDTFYPMFLKLFKLLMGKIVKKNL